MAVWRRRVFRRGEAEVANTSFLSRFLLFVKKKIVFLKLASANAVNAASVDLHSNSIPMRRVRTVMHAGGERDPETNLDANGAAQRFDDKDDDDGEKGEETRKGRLCMRGGFGEGFCWLLPAVLVVLVVYDFVSSTWFEREIAPIEAHAFGTKTGLRSEEDAQMLIVELKCKSSRGEKLYVHDVDEVGRCTGDDSLMHHERAWERRLVDRGAGWFTLRSLATRRWLAQGRQAVETRETADVLRDPHYHWRFRPDEYARSPTRNLENRATETRVEVVDLPSRPGSLLKAGWPSAFALRILSQTEFQVSVAAGEAEARAENRKLAADMVTLRRGFGSRNHERRVISMGLYGSRDKYTVGAIRNAELVDAFFPSWTLRVYADRNTVPNATIVDLQKRGADVKLVQSNRHTGAAAGMFWRFLVADDPSVDRFIVRDSDSRLNRRDAFAVLDWVRSGKPAHSLRDHPNHDRPLNGGMYATFFLSRPVRVIQRAGGVQPTNPISPDACALLRKLSKTTTLTALTSSMPPLLTSSPYSFALQLS